MKHILTAIGFSIICINLVAQSTYSKEIKSQIESVENNLSGRVLIDGKPYNILNRMAHHKVKGLSIAVVQNYKIVWAKGYGWADESEKRPVTTATLFEPGSISKSLNAVGVLKLVQDNKLSLETDINEYLKSWKFPYDSISKGKKITLANLLSHTAGLSVHGFPGYDRLAKIPTLPEVLDGRPPANTAAVRSLFEPGLKFQYSGGGTTISQLIVQDVTGLPYDQFMYNNVLKPIGMVNSFYSQPPGKDQKNLATGYDRNGAEIEHKFHVYPEQAAAGLWMTPSDLSTYFIEIQNALQGKSSKVLNEKMVKLYVTPYIDQSAALGLFIENRNGTSYFSHSAGNEGFRGLFMASMEGGNGVAIFVNSDNGNIIGELLNSVTTVYNWPGFQKPKTVNTIKIPDELAKKYIGTYLYDGSVADVTMKADGLYYWADGTDAKMFFTSDSNFINVEFQAEKTFMTDAGGKIIGYRRKVNGTEYPPAVRVTSVDTLKANNGQLNSFGWHLLLEKRFDEASAYLKRAMEIQPGDLSIKGNLAHVYLFQNQFDKSLGLYKEFLAQKTDDSSALKNMITEDFAYFRKNGFDKSLMDRMIAALKL